MFGLDNPEITINENLSRNVAAALLTLKENYLGPEPTSKTQRSRQKTKLDALRTRCRKMRQPQGLLVRTQRSLPPYLNKSECVPVRSKIMLSFSNL